MAKIRPVTLTSLMFCYQIIFMQASALDITLLSPQTPIKAAIGEELHITCLASKCSNKDPGFTWSSIVDKYLGGNIVTVEQRSTLTVEVRAETDGTYRCTVSCDNAPAEKSFTITVYSFPSDPVLHVSSLVVGQPSRITCIFPSIYPADTLTAEILMNDIIVASYEPEENQAANQNEIQNISLSHDIILEEEMDKYTILCMAKLEFADLESDPIERNTTKTLNLMYPPVKPQIIVQPSPIVKAGEEIRLICSSDSKFQAVVQWVKQIGDVEYEMSSDDQGSLILSNTEPENSGVYICYAQNSVGKTSSQMEISVRGPPENPMLSLKPSPTVIAGEAVTIECIASSDTTVTLWKISEDGDIFSLDSERKVVIDEADPIDAAVYKCTAENQYGVSETSQSLTVEYPPRETILSSSSIDVNEGDMVILTCVSQGVPTPNISISKLLTTGESVLLSEDSVIALPKVTSGIYQCLANNRLGSEKHKLELNVRVPPKNTYITITPSHTVQNGDSVHIRCLSEASPAPKLVLKMKTELGITELASEHGLYSIPHAAGAHTATYLCEASNIIGEQIAEATLTVQAAPQNTQISITPSSVVREGDNVHIRCTSEASPASRLALKMKMEHDVVDLVAEGGEYIISNAEERHIGIYICESTNVVGSEIVEAVLNVQVPPRNTYITITPSDVVREGDIVQIWCSSEGSPDPKLVLKMRTEDEVFSLESSDGVYNISHAGMENSGTYICESTNVLGLEEAQNTLTVQRRQQSPRFNPMSTIIFGSVAFVSVGVIGSIIYHLKKAKLQGSYSLVKALRSKV
ncbi:vascular cell adhesion protein 1 isoform X2 [Phyllobates terribilis]|uniref:vascular cell adhesion protein 1 isoform X2 n=1 Tax=Phyllobates terribilis TaxID=111132 RepID=UPI003CCAF72B